MKWYKIEIHTETEAVDVLTYLLEENGIEGAVIEDPNDEMFSDSYKGDWDYSEETARQFNHEDVVVKIFVSEEIEKTVAFIEETLKNIESNGLNIGTGQIKYEIVDDEDWKDKWKEYFKPFKIGSHIVIKPTWEDYQSEEGDIVIEMDPGSAFGSGTHETTSMCVKLVEKVLKDSDTVYDIGCGTGIIGLAAAKLGAKSVVGVDIAEDAIIATKENAAHNGLNHVVDARLGNLTDVLEDKADIVVANIMADIIIMMTETIENFVKKDGYYITSGIVNGREKDVLEVISSKFEVIEHINEGEWHAILAKYRG
ncbi:50S ribosomal protein L11 methyltransferase [Acidaminobacter sp. JC074]|uniref:50S ribosomal protein L11 methyltransferase n=1 Tax=Acidaminobacter sp. JC074 TaxID=2530199 RepID=UPI001F0E13FF|nr:50S ribosomal protein L11 methyltransferase [Acidaminobacter sp. JC074]MCH4887728.1 50S ribosomal protein L11 methyltransferase [Acidaminobacter sp. JC074]